MLRTAYLLLLSISWQSWDNKQYLWIRGTYTDSFLKNRIIRPKKILNSITLTLQEIVSHKSKNMHLHYIPNKHSQTTRFKVHIYIKHCFLSYVGDTEHQSWRYSLSLSYFSYFKMKNTCIYIVSRRGNGCCCL